MVTDRRGNLKYAAEGDNVSYTPPRQRVRKASVLEQSSGLKTEAKLSVFKLDIVQVGHSEENAELASFYWCQSNTPFCPKCDTHDLEALISVACLNTWFITTVNRHGDLDNHRFNFRYQNSE
jgi:hypothetical protein